MAEILNGHNWADGDGVIIESVSAIAVYNNDRCDVVIRQQADSSCGQDDDMVVIIPRSYVQTVIDALEKCIGTTHPEDD